MEIATTPEPKVQNEQAKEYDDNSITKEEYYKKQDELTQIFLKKLSDEMKPSKDDPNEGNDGSNSDSDYDTNLYKTDENNKKKRKVSHQYNDYNRQTFQSLKDEINKLKSENSELNNAQCEVNDLKKQVSYLNDKLKNYKQFIKEMKQYDDSFLKMLKYFVVAIILSLCILSNYI
jgi:chromosome segregation ATPase